jgi:hypothetical protein
VPWGLRPAVPAGASAVLLWFGAELLTSGRQAGLAERLLGGMQTLWPVLVILSRKQSRNSTVSAAFQDGFRDALSWAFAARARPSRKRAIPGRPGTYSRPARSRPCVRLPRAAGVRGWSGQDTRR